MEVEGSRYEEITPVSVSVSLAKGKTPVPQHFLQGKSHLCNLNRDFDVSLAKGKIPMPQNYLQGKSHLCSLNHQFDVSLAKGKIPLPRVALQGEIPLRNVTLAHHLDAWRSLTNDNVILSYVAGVDIPLIACPTQSVLPKCIVSGDEMQYVDIEISTLLERGIIQNSVHEQGEFISNVFLCPKKQTGKFRLILNLKHLNQFIDYKHFRMETVHTVADMVTPNSFMATIDLKDAYYSIPINECSQKFLKFEWRGCLYKYVALAFGLSCAPFIFTKVLKPVLGRLRGMGHKSVCYLDDIYVQADTLTSCVENVTDTCSLLTRVGFRINEEKSRLSPERSGLF